MKTDICTKCPPDKAVHPISNLVKDIRRKAGYQRLCKQCHNKRCRRYYKKKLSLNTENMYATGIEPEIRNEIMESEMPKWEERFRVIDHYRLDITKAHDTAKIDKVLALHGL